MIFFKRYFLFITMVPSKVLMCYEGTEEQTRRTAHSYSSLHKLEAAATTRACGYSSLHKLEAAATTRGMWLQQLA
jgi:hypothetical protein